MPLLPLFLLGLVLISQGLYHWSLSTHVKDLRSLMTKANEILDLIKKLNEATNAVALRIDSLVAQLAAAATNPDGLTAEQANEIAVKLTAERDRLTVLGQDTSDPIPVEPPNTFA